MTDSVRASVGNVVTDLSRSLGTLVGLFWLVFVGAVVLDEGVSLSTGTWSLPNGLFWPVAFAMALCGTAWLVEDGYDRLGADPTGAWTFVWLAVFLVPLAFLPLQFAVGSLASAVGSVDPFSGVLNAGFVLVSTIAAGWLAFYGGLERLGLELDDFVRTFVFAAGLALVPLAAVVLFDVSWLTDDYAAAAVALAVQVGAWWLGVVRTRP
ncbi:hypothetical protein EL22_15225 [Halostagnicola sp. A56]|uniref:hypothetical protein n=1 Tax=Halostagnicola sp. A56 TaxID=1495067 RepID=UPI00049F6BB6|nr:hypothetical protein [Halostagnicola sp. A56]KDE59929.1 hypothetical protein EL22_15225 [Halostagnicola sp. A56]